LVRSKQEKERAVTAPNRKLDANGTNILSTVQGKALDQSQQLYDDNFVSDSDQDAIFKVDVIIKFQASVLRICER
jgi:hypothetical protein